MVWQRYEVELHTYTTVYIEAGSPSKAAEIALERAQDDSWWLVHRNTLQANLKPLVKAIVKPSPKG